MNLGGTLKSLVLLLGLAGASWSWGGEVDSAFWASLSKVFPASNGWKNLSLESRSSRDPQLVEVRNGDALLGYGVSLYPASKSGPFRIVVAIAPDETVMSVRIPNYPHRQGRKVRKKAFLSQFNGVSYGAPLKLGEQVDGVSGATSSATAITRSVRQALLLVHQHRQKIKSVSSE